MQRNGSSHSKKTILVVEDEADAAELIRYNLEAAGFLVVVANDGAIALRRMFAATPDLVILDLMLPEIDGFEVCHRIRTNPATKKIPIVFLSGKTAELDRILALELGANDYVTKPFSPRELVLRVRNLLTWDDDRNAPEEWVIGDLSIDFPKHLVRVREQKITLTPTEFRLLRFLVERRNRVHQREQLLADVWKHEAHVDSRTVDTHIRRLRKKLSDLANYIGTVRGIGYRFSGPESR